VSRLKVRSCLIDGEAVACDENGLAVFERLRRKREARHVFLYAFDLLSLTAKVCDGSRCRFAKQPSPAFCADAYRACGSTSIYRTPAS
jgi:hypothetical protein